MTFQYVIYSITDYAKALAIFIKRNGIVYDDINDLVCELENDKFYHFRIHNNQTYVFFGDIDGYNNTIDEFQKELNQFLFTKYNLTFEKHEFMYTVNKSKTGSFHYSIPKWKLSCAFLKKIQEKFKKTFDQDLRSCIDTTIYSEHWFRLPNQSKSALKGVISDSGIHHIIQGNIKDFIVEYIPDDSIDIDNTPELCTDTTDTTDTTDNDKIIDIKTLDKVDSYKIARKKIDTIVNNNKDIIVQCKENSLPLAEFMAKPEYFKKIFTECYLPHRYEDYHNWISVGMALNNTFKDHNVAFELFDFFSKLGKNYECSEKTKIKFNSFVRHNDNSGYTMLTIIYYAIEDNKLKFIEISNKNKLDELEEADFCKYLKLLAGNRFVYQKKDDVYKLYCYNGKYWENDDVILCKYISTELYELIKIILTEAYFFTPNFNKLKNSLCKLKQIKTKQNIIKTYREFGINEDIRFDDKWYLLGFRNGVFDLRENVFRDYTYHDYIVTTTGYDWREPTEEELTTMKQIIDVVMPIKEERELYLQTLSTALSGLCLERFILHVGSGRNSKGMMNDLLLLALGNHALIANNSILFERNKTGANPEKANIHKKRFVLFREPPAKHKFENSIIKELTGGGTFSARTLHEKTTEKELNSTTICECNQRPLFAEEPTNADVERVIDFLFRATFTTDKTKLNPDKYIYLANPEFKTKEFQHKHKFALIRILLDYHYKHYHTHKGMLDIPPSIANRTKQYLNMSCHIIEFFNEHYDRTNNDSDMLKIKSIFESFKNSEYYYNMSKVDKRKYNYKYFSNYIQTHEFFADFYKARIDNVRQVLVGWKLITVEPDIVDLHDC